MGTIEASSKGRVGRAFRSSNPPDNVHSLPNECARPGRYRSTMATFGLMYADVILEGIRESKAPITPGHVERGTDEVVIRVVTEVRDNDRRNSAPVARSRGYGGVIPRRCARRARVYLE